MNMKFLLLPLAWLIGANANAAIIYRVQQDGHITATAAESKTHDNNHAFSDAHTFYVGGMYNFSMWADGNENDIVVHGDNTNSFEVVAGMRISDTFRIEANYIRTSAKWDAFSLTGDTVMANAIVDARIGNLYRILYHQRIVPYVGVGAGASWNHGDGVALDNRVAPVAAALAGVGFELGEYFALDFGYRYMYMFRPKLDVMPDFAPTAHQFRVGARVNF